MIALVAMAAKGWPPGVAVAIAGTMLLQIGALITKARRYAAHQHFIERRRELRPFGELRPATGEEWTELDDHFLLRKVAPGECHRLYGTPCVHEHACTRCRFLRVDPTQLPRIQEKTRNADDRLAEAKQRAWLGEVAALEDSLRHLRQRRAEAERAAHQPVTASMS